MTTATDGVEAPPVEDGRLRSYLSLYATLGWLSVIKQFQYRAAYYFYMIGMVTEPVLYLVVWSVVASQRGGAVGGYTLSTFVAYYIVLTPFG